MNNSKISHTRLYEQVIEQIETLYSKGSLKLGDRLPTERELAEKLGVSRGTLRDAFRVLESQGVVETKPGGGRYLRKDLKSNERSGSIVNDLQQAAMLDLLETRKIIEVGMMDLIIERATPKDLKKLEKIILNQKVIHSNDDTRVQEESFNVALAECSKNLVIKNFMKLNMEILNQTKEISYSQKQSFEDAQQEHFDILNAIKAKDVNLAKNNIIKHLDNIIKRTVK